MKTTKINNDLIRSFSPCYDPSEKEIPDGETLSVPDWVEKYRSVVPAKDIIWLLCHNEFLSDRDLRLFAVWCVREALSLIDSPDPRSVAACDVAERYANGNATNEELRAARAAADAARADAAFASAAVYAAYAAASYAASYADYATADDYVAAADYTANASYYAADADLVAAMFTREKQLVKLLPYFK